LESQPFVKIRVYLQPATFAIVHKKDAGSANQQLTRDLPATFFWTGRKFWTIAKKGHL
jgi:hypothetical protein